MKSSVSCTTKIGDFSGQGESKTYPALLGSNRMLVPMLARHISKTRKHKETTYQHHPSDSPQQPGELLKL